MANGSINIPKLNMEYHMLNVESRKRFKARSEKNLLFHAVIAQIQCISIIFFNYT